MKIKTQITNKALKKISDFGLNEDQVLDTFEKGGQQKWSVGDGWNCVKKYNGYEIGVAYFRNKEGNYVITSVWKRPRC